MQNKKGTRIRYALTYCKNQEDWDNGWYSQRSFDKVEEAMEWGKLNAEEFGFQIEKTEEFYKQPPAGMQWRKEEYAWEETDKERIVVYDGNKEYEVSKITQSLGEIGTTSSLNNGPYTLCSSLEFQKCKRHS